MPAYHDHYAPINVSGLGVLLPLPAKAKTPPPAGFTGALGNDPTPAQAAAWAEEFDTESNAALRLADGVIGIDVDQYDHKHGADSLEAAEASLGVLPLTLSVTSRGWSPSRIRLYRVPPGTMLASTFAAAGLGPDVEIIQRHHRYAVWAGSTHPNGRTYTLYDREGQPADHEPTLAEVPMLPEAWLTALAASAEQVGTAVVVAPESWAFAPHSSAYVSYVIGALAVDKPSGTWHDWLFSSLVRLADAHRLGRLAEADLNLAKTTIVRRLEAAGDERGSSEDPVAEAARCWRDAVALVSRKSEDQCWSSLGETPPSTTVVTVGADRSARNLAGHLGKTAQEMRLAYELYDSPPEERDLFYTYFDEKKGQEVITRRFLPQTVADYLDQGFALGHDGVLWKYEAGVYVRDPMEIRRRVAWVLGDLYTRTHCGQIEDHLMARHHRRLPEIPEQDVINVRNGLLEWSSGTLLPHDPETLTTVRLDVDYVPGATCPAFDSWLAEIVPEDHLEMMWEVLGYLMLHGNPLQVAILLHGSGGNGKGTLLRVLREIIGKHNTSSVSLEEIVSGTFETAAMYGKQANICGDIDATYLKHTAKFKAITGGDTINAQHKNQAPFEFTFWGVPVFSANDLWRSADSSKGYFRRWVALPFPTTLGREQGFREEILYAEATGIFAKAVVALGNLMRRGRFEVSQSSSALMEEFQRQADPVLSWLDEDDALARDEAIWLPRMDLYRRYADWCNTANHHAIATHRFYVRLKLEGFEPATRRGTRGFKGLGIAGVAGTAL